MSAKQEPQEQPLPSTEQPAATDPGQADVAPPRPREIGGPKGPEPTRYGDWEKAGRCIDF